MARTKLAIQRLTSAAQAARRRRDISPSKNWIDSLHWLFYPPKVAIVGPPNAGKSTIANQLFAQERSITADVPGTTRDWVGEIADVDGLAVFLIDTPGIRQTQDEIERTAIAQSSHEIGRADLVVLVLDGTDSLEVQGEWVSRFGILTPSPSTLGEGWGEGIQKSLEGPHPNPLPEYRARGPEEGCVIVVRNKCDRAGTIAPLNDTLPHVYTIATTGIGISELRQAIVRQFIRIWRQAM